MKKLMITMALLTLIGVPSAVAQSGNSSSTMTKGTGVAPAPIGHRQPRASDVPNEKSLLNPNDPVSKEDALLDKKIRSICRGC
jgi:hypothetical protein